MFIAGKHTGRSWGGRAQKLNFNQHSQTHAALMMATATMIMILAQEKNGHEFKKRSFFEVNYLSAVLLLFWHPLILFSDSPFPIIPPSLPK